MAGDGPTVNRQAAAAALERLGTLAVVGTGRRSLGDWDSGIVDVVMAHLLG